MKIVIGRGRSRVVHEMPCGAQIAAAARDNRHQLKARALVENVCAMVGVEPPHRQR